MEREANNTETSAHNCAVSVPQVRAAKSLNRMIGAERRSLRRQKRGKTGGLYETFWSTLKSLTELEGNPMRWCPTGITLADQVAMNVMRVQRRARQAAGA